MCIDHQLEMPQISQLFKLLHNKVIVIVIGDLNMDILKNSREKLELQTTMFKHGLVNLVGDKIESGI